MSKEVSNFRVMQRMADENMDIMLLPVGNIVNARYTRNGTKITIGAPGNLVPRILKGELCGGFILCNKGQFDALKKLMELDGQEI